MFLEAAVAVYIPQIVTEAYLQSIDNASGSFLRRDLKVVRGRED
jgi:hypothetical protein